MFSCSVSSVSSVAILRSLRFLLLEFPFVLFVAISVHSWFHPDYFRD
jgi:hypothetical protein